MSACKSCGAVVRWVLTEKGKAMPVDPLPTSTGNLRLYERAGQWYAHALTAAEREAAGGTLLDAPTPLHLSHFATCPNAKEHRR